MENAEITGLGRSDDAGEGSDGVVMMLVTVTVFLMVAGGRKRCKRALGDATIDGIA